MKIILIISLMYFNSCGIKGPPKPETVNQPPAQTEIVKATEEAAPVVIPVKKEIKKKNLKK